MKRYRISVNLNRITIPWQDDFERARAYHEKHGVDIQFIFKEIDVRGYASIYNTDKNRYLIQGAEALLGPDPMADADMFVFDQGEWAAPPGSPFPLLPETPNGSCFFSNGKPFICIGTYPTEHENGQTWIQIAHEIMHSYVQNAYLGGILIRDVMDTYRDNSDPDSLTGNFAEQWALLAPYLEPAAKPLPVALSPHLEYNEPMAKRDTTLGPKKKSRHSHKTKKRLAVKKEMLAKKASKKKSK